MNFEWLFNDINQTKQYSNFSDQAYQGLNLMRWHSSMSLKVSST